MLARYISGTRYKCAVCHDVDFCAKCEALPTNTHNRTHPLIKLNTPVRNVSVSTLSDDSVGRQLAMGDRVHKATSTEATTGSIAKRLDEEEVDDPPREEATGAPLPDRDSSLPRAEPSGAIPSGHMAGDSHAHAAFVRDTVPDGTQLRPNEVFQQTWTLHNAGSVAWPAGCAVRFVGGDSMFNVDTDHPSSLGSIKAAMESNTLSHAVEAGQKADFTVTMKTPEREGTSISYWRLKQADGTPFGDRLWCDVQVRADAGDGARDAAPAGRTDSDGGAMIFPLLEKESPVTSTHEAMEAEAAGRTKGTEGAEGAESAADVLEDVETLTLEDAESEEGFFTDDEYDILDASDREFLEGRQ